MALQGGFEAFLRSQRRERCYCTATASFCLTYTARSATGNAGRQHWWRAALLMRAHLAAAAVAADAQECFASGPLLAALAGPASARYTECFSASYSAISQKVTHLACVPPRGSLPESSNSATQAGQSMIVLVGHSEQQRKSRSVVQRSPLTWSQSLLLTLKFSVCL